MEAANTLEPHENTWTWIMLPLDYFRNPLPPPDADQPALGQRANTYMPRPVNGENYNLGLVDVTDRPYQELVTALVETHQRLPDIHAGKVVPTNQRAQRVVLSANLPGAQK